jgi:hypothetical protein
MLKMTKPARYGRLERDFLETAKRFSNHISPTELAFICSPLELPENIEKADADAMLLAKVKSVMDQSLLEKSGGSDEF